jgi:hypothetical protein
VSLFNSSTGKIKNLIRRLADATKADSSNAAGKIKNFYEKDYSVSLIYLFC